MTLQFASRPILCFLSAPFQFLGHATLVRDAIAGSTPAPNNGVVGMDPTSMSPNSILSAQEPQIKQGAVRGSAQ